MQKRIVSLIAFVTIVASSFYLGTFVNSEVASIEVNSTFNEVLNLLTNDHYTQPDEEELWDAAIDGMIASLDDPYTSYFDFEEYDSYQSGFAEDYVGVGVSVSFQNELVVIESVKENGPADEAGILVNDIIMEVNGESVEGVAFYDVINLVKGDVGTDVTLGIYRQGIENIIQLTITRRVIFNTTVTSDVFITDDGNKIGYIKVSTFGDLTATLFHDEIESLEAQDINGLVIDLRNNGGGHLSTVVSMLREFLIANGQEMFSTEAYQDGVFQRQEYNATNTERKEYEIITLVNESSASASEVFASAMQEQGDYTVIGTTTFGKGTMQIDQALNTTDEDSIHLTIGKWITADGNWVHYSGGTGGVTPDIVIERSIYESAYKLFLFDDEELIFDTVDSRIKNLQVILNSMDYGFDVREDGYFDQDTKDAIMQIQLDNALPVDGNVNSSLLEIINLALDTYQDNIANDTQFQGVLDYFDGILTIE